MMRIDLGENARRVLEARYLRRGASGEMAETPEQLFRRVARAVPGVSVRDAGKTKALATVEPFDDDFARPP